MIKFSFFAKLVYPLYEETEEAVGWNMFYF
jgi:hypothetical protein